MSKGVYPLRWKTTGFHANKELLDSQGALGGLPKIEPASVASPKEDNLELAARLRQTLSSIHANYLKYR